MKKAKKGYVYKPDLKKLSQKSSADDEDNKLSKILMRKYGPEIIELLTKYDPLLEGDLDTVMQEHLDAAFETMCQIHDEEWDKILKRFEAKREGQQKKPTKHVKKRRPKF